MEWSDRNQDRNQIKARAMLRNNCRNCVIRDSTLCRALPESALNQLNLVARRRKLGAGARLLDADLETPMVANIVSGVVRLSKSLADGRTQIVGLQFPTEFLGQPFTRNAALLAEAATDVELCCFPQAQFEAMLLAHNGLKELFTQRVMQQLDAARDWMLLLGRKTAEERVATLILYCAEKLADDTCAGPAEVSGMEMELPLSRTEMADFLGLTLETVGRMIKRLEQAGVVDIRKGRGLHIRDGEALRRHAASEAA